MTITVVNKRKHKPTPHDFYCGRPSVLGNPYSHIKDKKTLAEFVVENREEAIEKHREYFYKEMEHNETMQKEFMKIQSHLEKFGKVNLVCWCSPAKCHCDTIKEYLELSYWADAYHNANLK